MIYKIMAMDNMETRLIYSERVFSPVEIVEAIGRMENSEAWKTQFDKEHEDFVNTKQPF